MRGLLFVIGLLTAPLGVSALTWDFDEDTTWGWTARESILGDDFGSSSTTVYSEVADGVWRIAPVPNSQRPAINLRSPPIGEDSVLFDRVTLRLRIVHDRPTEGRIQMAWFNAEYRRLKKESGSSFITELIGRFFLVRTQRYPTEWEDITVDLRTLAAALKREITWQDTLFDFQIELDLNEFSQGPADHPVFLEVDWIQLTGTEELLLGELQPREVSLEVGLPGRLFAELGFFPLGEGIEDMRSGYGLPQSALGDVDGDGDVDLVTDWTRSDADQTSGWMVASNDGLGRLVPFREYTSTLGLIIQLQGGDFNGDGLLDLAFADGRNLELWLNKGEDGFEAILQLSDVLFNGLVDGDGDGDVDLLSVEVGDSRSNAILWLNDGNAGFTHSDRFAPNSEEKLFPFALAGYSLGEAVRLLWVRPCYQPQGTWQLTQPWAASEEPMLLLDPVVNPCNLHLLADLDDDGTAELIGAAERDLQFDPFYTDTTYHGLALWRLDESDELVRHILLDLEVLLPHRAIAHDLNGDGLLDLAVVDGNLATGPALVVLIGQRAGLPVVEGRYRLPGTGGSVLAGDLNGDGATDLVVLGRNMEGGPGGAFVLLNQNTPATAIAAETATTPSTFVLGANYPNPFNPATTIPLTLPAGASEVDLTIYNVLGQPVRRVWTGSLVAGKHQLAWDGRDMQGQLVAAGVYWYRLQVDDQTSTRKMLKIE